MLAAIKNGRRRFECDSTSRSGDKVASIDQHTVDERGLLFGYLRD